MLSPLEAVSAQLAAYNAHDLETFVALYADEVKLWRNGKLTCDSRATMREQYGALFQANPDLKALLLGRLVGGATTVIDHEWVTGLKDGYNLEVFATFEVLDGIITQAWFRQERRVPAS
jgi:hypothetical protein